MAGWYASRGFEGEYAMSEREHAHELIDRLPETQLSALIGLLETIIDPVAAALRKAPIDDEPETEEERQAVGEAGIRSPSAAAKAFRTRKRCAAWAWSETDRVTDSSLDDMAALDKGIARRVKQAV